MTRSQYGLIAIAIGIYGVTAHYTGVYRTAMATKPYRSVCFLDDSKELPNFTPAYWVEREGMKFMEYERMNLKCRGDVGGFMAEWESDQFWLRRVGAKKVTTR